VLRAAEAIPDERSRQPIGDVLNEIANALQETIGLCAQFREEGHLTSEKSILLQRSIQRATAALKRLQPASRGR